MNVCHANVEESGMGGHRDTGHHRNFLVSSVLAFFFPTRWKCVSQFSCLQISEVPAIVRADGHRNADSLVRNASAIVRAYGVVTLPLPCMITTVNLLLCALIGLLWFLLIDKNMVLLWNQHWVWKHDTAVGLEQLLNRQFLLTGQKVYWQHCYLRILKRDRCGLKLFTLNLPMSWS